MLFFALALALLRTIELKESLKEAKGESMDDYSMDVENLESYPYFS